MSAAPAILGVDGVVFTYRDLFKVVSNTAFSLRAQGVAPDDTVALVAPDGPGAALAFLGIAAAAACAPLNPSYSEADFSFYLEDLNPKALLLPDGLESPAIAVAQAKGIRLLRFNIPDPSADRPTLLGGEHFSKPATAPPDPASDSVALILHTSGTTSRPKMVALTHANLLHSARSVAETLRLASTDRGLVVMPLFHIHGIVGALLSTLFAGASAVCTPGFRSAAFFEWARDLKATWYSAVPTIHQAVLDQAKADADATVGVPLRLVRSSSSALPPTVFHDLEATLKVPVIESYGMTEAAHQMASNLLPPGIRKPGSVGVAAGAEVAILDEAGTPLADGQTGEIAIRGPNVMTGYRSNPEANVSAFVNGWFRTGDQGHLDEDGYLFLTGRLKEMINRGGENIAPKEIDEALLAHPAVAQAIAFAVPHPTLGEDLAAAIVPREGHPFSELELRTFVAGRLAGFKVPSRIIRVDLIPKGPTGKLQRIGLYDKLKHAFVAAFEAPSGDEEQVVADAFAAILKADRVGRNDNYFSLGGDSLNAQKVLALIRQRHGAQISPGALFRYPTPRLLAAEVVRVRDAEAELDALATELRGYSPEEIEKLLGDSAAG